MRTRVPSLTCLKSAVKVMSAPSACRYSTLIESRSLSASSSSSLIRPSGSRTRTFSSEHKPALSTEAQRNRKSPTEPGDPNRANIPKPGGEKPNTRTQNPKRTETNRRTDSESSGGEPTRLIPPSSHTFTTKQPHSALYSAPAISSPRGSVHHRSHSLSSHTQGQSSQLGAERNLRV